MQFTEVMKWISVTGGAALVGIQLAGRADDALLKHLDSQFASKAEVQAVDRKVDQVLYLLQHKR